VGIFSTLFPKRTQLASVTESDTLAAIPEIENLVITPEQIIEPAPEPNPAPEVAVPTAVALVASVPEAAPEVDISQLRAQAEEIVRSVVHELPDFITVAVVEGASGRILAGKWTGNSGGAVEVATANAEIMRQTYQAIEALQLGPDEQLDDILVMLRYQLHILRVLPHSDWLLYLAIRTQDSNLGLARTVLRNQAA
jgi:hypothetical protein